MKKILLIFSLFLSFCSMSHAQVGQLLGWQFSNPASASPAVPTAAFYQSLAVEASTLTRGSGFLPANLARGFSSTSSSSATSTPTVRDVNEYYQFTFQPKSGSVISLSGINAKLRRTGGGPNTYRWAYSINNGTFTDVGTTDITFSDTNSSGVQQATINLNDIPSLQNLTSSSVITFRLYGWGFSTSSGTFAFGVNTATDLTPSLALMGTVVGSDRLLAWDFNIANSGAATTGAETSIISTLADPNLNASTLTKNGFGNGSLPRGISAIGTIGTTKVDAEYYEFDVSPSVAGKYISLFSIEARLRRTSGGATTYSWSYSVNNGAFVQLGSPVNFVVTDDGYFQPAIDLSGIAALKNLQAGTSVKFRLHGWGFTTSGGTFAIGRSAEFQVQNSLEVTGRVTAAPLPVSLTNFTAKANKQGTVNLAWSTSSEQNNSHFEVTRSADGKAFSKIGQVTGANNSSTVKNYSYVDGNPVAGVNYYQLKQVDFDGTSSLSKVAFAKVGLGTNDLTVGVSANRTSLTANYNASVNGKATFAVYTVAGAKVASVEQNVTAGNNQVSLPVSLGNSLHILKVTQGSQSISVKF